MRGLTRLYRRFIASRRAVAAIEFAIMLPVLVVMFLASVDAGRAIGIYMKVRAATYTLGAVTNQYTTIQSADMTSILGATTVVLSPYSSSPVVVTITQIAISAAGKATVSWSASLNGTALTRGTNWPGTVPTGFANPSTYVVAAQVSYTYTPIFTYFSKTGFTLSDSLYVTPRSSTCIIYAVVSSSC